MRKSSVFITRDLNGDSPFYNKLTAQGYAVEGKSFIEFTAIPFKILPDTDWLFFYSKNGVRFFLQYPMGKQAAQHRKIATIGSATANLLFKDFKCSVDFIGTGDPISTAQQLESVVSHSSILFISAANTKDSVRKYLKNSIKSNILAVYQNNIKKQLSMKQHEFLVFTSPLNVEAYFQQFLLLPHQKIVAIGNTTAKALHNFGFEEIVVSDKPTEMDLANKIIAIDS